MSKVLILGLGNILLSDDAAGVRTLERLQARYHLPQGVSGLDGGVRGQALLPFLEGVSRLVIIDAVRAGGRPGALVRVEGDHISTLLGPRLSPHQEGLADLLWVAQTLGIAPPEIVLWGIEAASLDVGLELSPPVAGQVDSLVDRIVEELRGWGLELKEREALCA